MTSNIYVTKEGLNKLQKELEQLKSVRRKEVIERIKEARGYGDLSENSEYEDAKDEQAFVEGRIKELENIIKKAKIIQKGSGDKVSLGSKAKVAFLGKEVIYEIVGKAESDPSSFKISSESPLGLALIGKGKGEKAEVRTPSGKTVYTILEIK